MMSGINHKRIFLTALSVAYACFMSGSSPALASQIGVDGSQTLVQGVEGDDLATAKNIYQGANVPANNSLPLTPIVNAIGMQRMRLLQNDNYTGLDDNGNFLSTPPGQWDGFTYELDLTLQNHLVPHLAVAATLSPSFVKYGPAETWSPQTMALYQSYAQQLVRYVVQEALKYGVGSVVFEVSNEMDAAENVPPGFDWSQMNQPPPANPMANATLAPLGPWGRFLWWIDPTSYNFYEWPPDSNSYPFGGDMRRVEHGISPMQKVWGDAINAAKSWYAQNPDPSGRTVKIEFAGPATCLFTFLWAENPTTHAQNPTIEEKFLDTMFDPNTDAGKFNTSLDYISFHFYGDFLGQTGGYGQLGSPTSALKYVTDRLRTKLAALGKPNMKFFISEWGPSACSVSDTTCTINYSHLGAAWAAAFLNEAVKDGISMGSFLIVQDALSYQTTGATNQPSYMAMINGVLYPKPVTNVFEMYNMMSGKRNLVTLPSDRPNLGAFAASDKNSAGLLVYNYNSSFTTTNENVAPNFHNLPFSGLVTVERYLIDANTSNLYAYLNNPSHPDPSLQKVESFQAVVDLLGNLVLPPVTLGASGVTFWHVVSMNHPINRTPVMGLFNEQTGVSGAKPEPALGTPGHLRIMGLLNPDK